MSTHHKVKDALEKSIQAQRRAHHDHLAQADLQDYTDNTMSPLGPAGDMGAVPADENG